MVKAVYYTTYTFKIFFLGVILALLILRVLDSHASDLPETIYIRLFETKPNIQTLEAMGPFRLTSANQTRYIHVSQTVSFRATSEGLLLSGIDRRSPYSSSKKLVIEPEGSDSCVHLRVFPGKTQCYAGMLIITQDIARHIHILNQLPMHHYVARVVQSEMPATWPIEAQKALAVVVQTRLLWEHHHRHKEQLEVGDSTQLMFYQGNPLKLVHPTDLFRSVWGVYLATPPDVKHQGDTWKPVEGLYHASCAGQTSSSEFFLGTLNSKFLKNQGSMPGVVCPFCKRAPLSQMHIARIPKAQWQSVFPSQTPYVLERDWAKRPVRIALREVGQADKILSGYAFWLTLGKRFGWDKVPGTRYWIKRLSNGDIEFRSNGGGHGVGLCQWGAKTLAESGYSYHKILNVYFPKACIVKGLPRH